MACRPTRRGDGRIRPSQPACRATGTRSAMIFWLAAGGFAMRWITSKSVANPTNSDGAFSRPARSSSVSSSAPVIGATTSDVVRFFRSDDTGRCEPVRCGSGQPPRTRAACRGAVSTTRIPRSRIDSQVDDLSRSQARGGSRFVHDDDTAKKAAARRPRRPAAGHGQRLHRLGHPDLMPILRSARCCDASCRIFGMSSLRNRLPARPLRRTSRQVQVRRDVEAGTTGIWYRFDSLPPGVACS